MRAPALTSLSVHTTSPSRVVSTRERGGQLRQRAAKIVLAVDLATAFCSLEDFQELN